MVNKIPWLAEQTTAGIVKAQRALCVIAANFQDSGVNTAQMDRELRSTRRAFEDLKQDVKYARNSGQAWCGVGQAVHHE